MFFIGTSARTNNEVYSKIPLQQMKKKYSTRVAAHLKKSHLSAEYNTIRIHDDIPHIINIVTTCRYDYGRMRRETTLRQYYKHKERQMPLFDTIS